MTTPKPAPNRLKVPLYVMMPPDERERLDTFAASIGRPFSWVVRDAVRVYLDAVGRDARKLASLRADLAAPDVNLGNAVRTVQSKMGRPPKGGSKAYVR